MDPLFSLPTSPSPIFGRTTNFEFKKVLPDSIFDTGRPAARHVFRWQNQAAEWWVPAQSYLRIRCSFLAVNAAGTGLRPVIPADGIAPVMNLPAHIFNRIEYFMDGNKLSDLQDYVPEIDTMKTRMNKSKAWFRSVGARSAFWESDFGSRQARICPQFSTGPGGDHSLGDNVQTQTLSRKLVLCWQGYAFNLAGERSATSQSGGAGPHMVVYKEGNAAAGNAGDRGLGVFSLDRKNTWAESASDAPVLRSVLIGLRPTGLGAEPLTSHADTIAIGEGIPAYASFRRTGEFNTGMQTVTGRWFAKAGVFLYDKKKLFNSDGGETATESKRTSEGGRVITQPDFVSSWDGIPNAALTADTNLVELVIRPLKEADFVEKATRHEICWKPPLGIFDVAHAIPTTRHELHLVIPTDYQTRCIDFGFQPPDGVYPASRILDPRRANALAGANDINKIFFRIDNIEFFAGMATGPRADDAKFVLDLREYRMFPQTIPTGQEGTSNTYVFNLSSNSASVSVAFQSSTAGNGSSALSKFHIPTLLDEKGGETSLKRFYVNFANQNRPREENESKILLAEGVSAPNAAVVDEGNTVDKTPANFFMQRYLESMLNTSQLYKAGGCETFEEWLQRGVFYNWVWPRDGSDLSTRFHVFVSFETTIASEDSLDTSAKFSLSSSSGTIPARIRGTANLIRILVFDMVPRAYMLSIRNGAVVGAETSNVMVADGVRRLRTDVM